MIWRLRVCLFYFVVAVATIGLFPILLLAKVLNLSYHYKYWLAELYSIWFILAAKVICGLRYEVSGLEKLPNTPAVLLANHQSFWENLFLQLIIPQHTWVLKKELLSIPFFGWGLKMLDPIAIERKDNMSVNQITKCGKQKLAAGLWVIIFPEATRIRPNEHRKYKTSGMKLAMEAKVPAVLLAHNAGTCWPKDIWIQNPGLIKVEIISVIEPSQMEGGDVRHLTAQVEEIINHHKNELAKL